MLQYIIEMIAVLKRYASQYASCQINTSLAFHLSKYVRKSQGRGSQMRRSAEQSNRNEGG